MLAASFSAQAAARPKTPPRASEALRAVSRASAPTRCRPVPVDTRPRRKKKGEPIDHSAAPEVGDRVLNARPDTLDFRDLMYTPTLVEVPTYVPLNDPHEFDVPILDRGCKSACTGFGLATVANHLLLRRRVVPDPVPVSPRMFYELARRCDEWLGEDRSGSRARGAMKGWHKHGVCSEAELPYRPADKRKKPPGGLTEARTSSALQRPLGAYFRVGVVRWSLRETRVCALGSIAAGAAPAA